MKKFLRSSLIGGIVLLGFTAIQPAMAVASWDDKKTSKQQANTIILEMSGAKKDDIDDLRHGEGKLFKKIASMIERLQQSGQVGENIQPIIVIVKQKKSKGLLD
jgi:TolA-binding protein